jgi:serine/threonine protein kinase
VKSSKIDLDNWKVITLLGKGAQCSVYLWKDTTTEKRFALKLWSRKTLSKGINLFQAEQEVKILRCMNHPFIIKGYEHYNNEKYGCVAIELWRGGDLFHHLSRINKVNKRFTEETAKFYIGSVILALEELHKAGFIYRDLKPENILLDDTGYIKIWDFGLWIQLKKVDLSTCKSQRGSKEYFPPEVIRREIFDFSVDWWGLGILTYELFHEKTPFRNENIFKEQQAIRYDEVKIDESLSLSKECQDFISKLLDKNKHTRLGAQGVSEIKSHPWLSSLDWEKLIKKELKAPYVPKVEMVPDTHYFDEKFTTNKVLRHLYRLNNF